MTLPDYETLRLAWWVMLGVLIIGFAVLDGFDLGLAALLPWLGEDEAERGRLIELVEPVWEGNQVWLVVGAAASFAAWPLLYAVAFSTLYLPLLVLLVALILRPAGFKFRSKLPAARWRRSWDAVLVVGGAVPAFVFGAALGQVLLGLPFRFDADLRIAYSADPLGGHPFVLLCGALGLVLACLHGATHVAMRTEGEPAARAGRIAWWLGWAGGALFVACAMWTAFVVDGHVVVSGLEPDGASNPLGKLVEVHAGGWIAAYLERPSLALIPVAGLAAMPLAGALARGGHGGRAFAASAIAMAAALASVAVALFPFLLPSALDPGSGLTVWDASASPATLFAMLIAVAVMAPIIAAYTTWAWRVLTGPPPGGSDKTGGY